MPCWSETPQGIQIVSVNSQIKKIKKYNRLYTVLISNVSRRVSHLDDLPIELDITFLLGVSTLEGIFQHIYIARAMTKIFQ